jgi:hypothetical protein
MAETSKMVACEVPGCSLEGVVYEIPYAMLMSPDEPVMCGGGCLQETAVISVAARGVEVEPVNAQQILDVAALGRTTFFQSDVPLPSA